MKILELYCPVYFRENTWSKILNKFALLSDIEIRHLCITYDLGLHLDTRGNGIMALVELRSLLLIELGLTTDHTVMFGTVFSYGGIEYVIGGRAIDLLCGKTDTARISRLGQRKYKTFTYSQLMTALRKTPDFDQLKLKTAI